MVYVNPEDYPTLSSILQNAAVGMAAGATVGSVAGGLGRVVNRRRNAALRDRQEIIGTLEYDGFTTDVVDYDPETRTATVMHPQYEKPVKVPDVDIDMMRPISTGELKQRARRPGRCTNPTRWRRCCATPAKIRLGARCLPAGNTTLPKIWPIAWGSTMSISMNISRICRIRFQTKKKGKLPVFIDIVMEL